MGLTVASNSGHGCHEGESETVWADSFGDECTNAVGYTMFEATESSLPTKCGPGAWPAQCAICGS